MIILIKTCFKEFCSARVKLLGSVVYVQEIIASVTSIFINCILHYMTRDYPIL